MQTRNMQGFTAGRIASESITLIYNTYVDSGDGSAVVTQVSSTCLASVGALQKKDIERLEKAGITVRSGVTIVIPSAPDQQPDIIKHYSKNYRVLDWATKNENGNLTVIATCDEITIAGAA